MSYPLGGGSGYPDTVTEDDADVVVSTVGGLNDAIDGASGDDVVFIDGDARINADDLPTKGIRSGVTLASDRGVDGSRGALLYETQVDQHIQNLESYKHSPQFVAHADARLTGFRLIGSLDYYFDHWPTNLDPGDIVASGVRVSGAQIDNCEVSGWPTMSITANRGSVVRGCKIEKNLWDGYGYGIMSQSGDQTIEYNEFDYNRHSIAGTGTSEAAYVLRYNKIGPHHIWIPIDMHPPGGRRVVAHHNTVELKVYNSEKMKEEVGEISKSRGQQPGADAYAFTINGIPSDGVDIYNNWFFAPRERCIYPRKAHGNVDVGDRWLRNNHFGESPPADPDIGAPREPGEPEDQPESEPEPVVDSTAPRLGTQIPNRQVKAKALLAMLEALEE